MKNQFAKFTEFLKTPFPYLFLALCIFLASTLLGNEGFRKSMTGPNPEAKTGERYELCLVCSGPGANDPLSDLGFTVANFVLFPVTLAASGVAALARQIEPVNNAFVYGVYLFFSILYGIVVPFVIFLCYEAIEARIIRSQTNISVYTR
ncbi:MAG: hypothetical protein OEM82_00180 [Acidobacteriota bacterium]|nr:hypothetical protein [Acidobacteriota bacterium]MDH3528948.1 hypothetical protein [Acidobacteriota bacterium]